MKKRFKIATGTIFISLIVTVLILNYPKEIKEPDGIDIDKTRFPITGIDVSKHTGKVDFQKIKEQFQDTLDFVYIKATEGTDLVDKNLDVNFVNARQSSIPVGVYHFFKFNVGGLLQAQNFLQAIHDKSLDLPLVLDVEEWRNAYTSQPNIVISEIRLFIEEVEKRKKNRVMIYTNESSYQRYIKGNFDLNKIWICSFNEPPKIESKWTLWQHSHKGRLKGAEGWIDINTFNGSREEWKRFLN